MDKQPVGQLPDLTQSNNDDEIMVITNSEYNQLKKEKISDFITDLTSTNENNALTKGTDGKMFVTDFGNASNITEGTLPTSVLPEIPLEKIPDIPKDKLPSIETSDLPDSGITAGTYTYPTDIVINSKGQVTSITEGQPGANNANQDLSNLSPEGEKHFVNKSQISNCILEAPNGVATYSGNTITVKQGLKVLIPNGRNADGTLKNIEYTVPNDITELATIGDPRFNNTPRLCFLSTEALNLGDNNYTIGCQEGFYTEGNILPSNTFTSFRVHYKTDENKMYYCKANTTDWVASKLVPIAMYLTTTTEITTISPFQPFRAIDYNDTGFMAHQAMPSSNYINLSLPASEGTLVAPADGYAVINASSNTAYAYISLNIRDSTNTIGILQDLKIVTVTGKIIATSLPVSKGEFIQVGYYGISLNSFKFVYANGSL